MNTVFIIHDAETRCAQAALYAGILYLEALVGMIRLCLAKLSTCPR